MKKIKTFLYIFISVPVLLSTLSCKDPILYHISEEIPLKDPMIEGSPTNFIMFDNILYVATGKTIFAYNGAGTAPDPLWPMDEPGKWRKRYVKTKPFSNYNIIQLAETSSRVYALCYRDTDNTTSRKIIYADSTQGINDGSWYELTGITKGTTGDYNIIHSIYTANDNLYIGVQYSGGKPKDPKKERDRTNEYDVLVLNADNTTFTRLLPPDGPAPDDNETTIYYKDGAVLYGVAYNGKTFLCTGKGIFLVNDAGDASSELREKKEENGVLVNDLTGSFSMNFVGIITLPDNSIAAIRRNGTLYEADTVGLIKRLNFTDNQTKAALKEKRWATGAMAICSENYKEELEMPLSKRKILLVGRRDIDTSTTTGYTFGYLELELNNDGSIKGNPEPDGSIKDNRFNQPGEPNKGSYTSVVSDAASSYASSIGVISIKYIIQAPNGFLFASTQFSGVWSYKFRKDGKKHMHMWNAEEK